MPPARQRWRRTARRRAQFLRHREPDARGDLFGAQKVFVRYVLERAAIERDEALIAVHIGTLVDGHGKVPLAEQRGAGRIACRDCRGHAVFVEAGAGAHLVGGDEIHHQHPHGTVALRLQNETAIDLQRRAQHHRQHQRFTKELGDGLRIGVPRKDFVDGRAKTNHAAAQVELGHLERHDGVVERGG